MSGVDRTADGQPGTEPVFPVVARLELDELLTQLVDRAQDVLATQGRLRGLLRANQMVAADLSLPVVLRRIVEAACDLLDARYGALGVIGGDRHLEQFIHVGVDESDVARIGRLPEGKGILGLLIEQPNPLRLGKISDDPRAHGFPAGHPHMDTFIGVSISIRGEAFGNLYLAQKRGGRLFTAEDEELVVALASSAAVAIDNARLFAEAQRRLRWLQASTEITRQLLAGQVEPLSLIAGCALDVAAADFTLIILQRTRSSRLVVEVAIGEHADLLAGVVVPPESMAGRAVEGGEPLLLAEAAGDTALFTPGGLDVGPVLIVPLAGIEDAVGALVLGRRKHARGLREADLDMAVRFAGHIELALELARARATRERLVVLEERERIARDLHGHVIQRLFATALGMQGLAARDRTQRMSRYVEEVDETIREIRNTVFELPRHGQVVGSGLRARIAAVVDDVGDILGFAPRLRFAGPVDSGVSEGTAEHLLAVLREGLTNVARHAQASGVTVSVVADTVDSIVTLDVVDDGVGIGVVQRSSGLANMGVRAQELGGTCTVTPGQTGGTHLRWVAPAN
ncbi:GAF domain-containing protein [Frankia sp. Cas3]|uniref:sensor histidine kinase n=1 Tax=Frankia sp. Cas3 TaxID=3073926 RepID=UPI002AD28B04|nr:GAF domain-containing protein [Frankia sp. Cas3]